MRVGVTVGHGLGTNATTRAVGNAESPSEQGSCASARQRPGSGSGLRARVVCPAWGDRGLGCPWATAEARQAVRQPSRGRRKR